MPDYVVPLRDIEFALAQSGALGDTDTDIVSAVLVEAARFVQQEVASCHEAGDRIGCTLSGTEVVAPPGFQNAYQAFCEGGWPGLAQDEQYGGQGLPLSLHMAVYEMLTSANLAWSLYPTTTWGSVATVTAHGTDEQKAYYLPKLISGEWTGTMCLTESQAGSDLGLLRSKAVPKADGSYALTGSKIFISSGEHDLAGNIVHLTLARLPDAPAGTGGISLFLVPKILPDGERNTVSCGGIEEKMGIHGNATCSMNFDGATGYLLGKANRGLAAMFTFINESRIEVCLQAQGQMERAYQASLAYARERRQMRSAPRLDPQQAADPIIGHADVQRLLLTQRSFSEAARLFAYELAGLLQKSRHVGDSELCMGAQRRLALLTPIAKGFISEVAQEATSHAIQVHGGHGFITETGVEQLYRDVRITAIYEGTTAIQGVDLLTRKLLADQGEEFQLWLAEMRLACGGEDGLSAKLRVAIDQWDALTRFLLDGVSGDGQKINMAAVNYLMYSGYVISAWLLVCAAHASAQEGDDFSRARVESAGFYLDHILPRITGLEASLRAGTISLFSGLSA